MSQSRGALTHSLHQTQPQLLTLPHSHPYKHTKTKQHSVKHTHSNSPPLPLIPWKAIRITNSSYSQNKIDPLIQSLDLHIRSTLEKQIKVSHGTSTPIISGLLHTQIKRPHQGPLLPVLRLHHSKCKLYSLHSLTITIHHSLYKKMQYLIISRNKYQKSLKYSLGTPV